jgi:hypothetical protein
VSAVFLDFFLLVVVSLEESAAGAESAELTDFEESAVWVAAESALFFDFFFLAEVSEELSAA